MFEVQSRGRDVVLTSEDGRRLRIAFLSPSIARITYTKGKDFEQRQSRIVVLDRDFEATTVEDLGRRVLVSTSSLSVEVDKATAALSYYDGERNLLFREPEQGGKWLTPKAVYVNVFSQDNQVAFELNTDGARAITKPSEVLFDREVFEGKLEFVFSEDEALYGLGSHEEGYCNLRGKSRELYQQNMKAVVPFIVSTRGYGVLLDCCSLMTFHDDELGSYWSADVIDELDFYVIQGDRYDDITRSYHALTGQAPMLPKWAFGYIQSKERYINAQELVDVVAEYRRRSIPLDCIVLDWKSWPDGGGWGQKSFDAVRFPDPLAMTEAIHAMHAHLMISIWPIMTGGCANQRELLELDLMLGNQSTYDAFRADARSCYWRQAKSGLFDFGVDAWWCDCTEPFEADWFGALKPEPQERLTINTNQSKLYLEDGEINAYSLVHSQGIYEGQRAAASSKRVVNLTRSSYAGQHRYGTITWSGDITGTWETLRRSIPEGLNFCATGEPYWTVDIGGFFVGHNPDLWFWHGDYVEGCRGLTDMHAREPDTNDNGCSDRAYWELYTRWVQYAAFLPMFRSHGTDAAREIWRFGETGGAFYDTIADFIRLRYQLLPYTYSLAAQVTLKGNAMMRALALEFPRDLATHDVGDTYLFGPSILVSPVTSPMYYGPGSRALMGVPKTKNVYLPLGCKWFDFWTNALIEGGKVVVADAPIEKLPLFIRAGSILPMTKAMQYADEIPDAPYDIRVYSGADATFDIYEDAGDGYDYENGRFSIMTIAWTEEDKVLALSSRRGSFDSLIEQRQYNITVIHEDHKQTNTMLYNGSAIQWKASD